MRDILDELVAKGVRADTITRITKALEALAARREHDRQRASRYRHVTHNVTHNVTGNGQQKQQTHHVTDLGYLTKKEVKKESKSKNPKNWPADYRERFWAAYPRKVAKIDALKSLDKACLAGAIEFPVLLMAVARIDVSDPKFIKHPATWLNKGCYLDGETAPDLSIEARRAAFFEEQRQWNAGAKHGN